MKTIIKITLFFYLAIIFSGCSSYWRYRNNDLADIVTLSTNIGFGAKARVGPFHAGLLAVKDTAGLRGGKYIPRDNGFTIQMLLLGGEIFNENMNAINKISLGDNELTGRGKEYANTNIIVNVPLMEKTHTPATYYTQIETIVSIGGGIRVGFNIGEFFDFIFGFTGLDIYGDDIEDQKEIFRDSYKYK